MYNLLSNFFSEISGPSDNVGGVISGDEIVGMIDGQEIDWTEMRLGDTWVPETGFVPEKKVIKADYTHKEVEPLTVNGKPLLWSKGKKGVIPAFGPWDENQSPTWLVRSTATSAPYFNAEMNSTIGGGTTKVFWSHSSDKNAGYTVSFYFFDLKRSFFFLIFFFFLLIHGKPRTCARTQHS